MLEAVLPLTPCRLHAIAKQMFISLDRAQSRTSVNTQKQRSSKACLPHNDYIWTFCLGNTGWSWQVRAAVSFLGHWMQMGKYRMLQQMLILWKSSVLLLSLDFCRFSPLISSVSPTPSRFHVFATIKLHKLPQRSLNFSI